MFRIGQLGDVMIFFALGPLQAGTAGRKFSIETPSARTTLIALLIEEGRPVQTPVLLKRIWESPPKSAASNLRLYVSRLRDQLNSIDPELGGRISTIRGGGGESGGYLLRITADDLDIMRFQQITARGLGELRAGDPDAASASLTRALGLWRGAVGQDCVFSSRVRAQFDTLDQLRTTARERLIEALLSLGRSAELLPEIRRVLELEPHREKSWENLIRAHYLSGDIANALGAWNLASEALRDGFGLDLSPDLRRLHLAVLRRDDDAIRRFTEFS
ncbi:BTAD domain-containing putative transcriptional regulator [Streptomyces sp. NPDC091371]|uniref:AfsR/SARP family transcriptional regulator n=1 Tax=Streptomyces sp. NPDC091371 TaxID=3155303 RepID=UPI00343A2BA0